MNHIILEILLIGPPLLLALTLHEVAHGYVAYKLGDPTAKALGRLTLNPLKHLDPLGTLAFFLIKIGWARPIPVNPRYLQNPKQDMLWVALAGPATNLVLAVLSAALAKTIWLFTPALPSSYTVQIISGAINAMLLASVWINLVLCIFNFLPIPPLDGSKILHAILPASLARSYLGFEKYGFILILLLAFSGILGKIILPIISFANNLLIS